MPLARGRTWHGTDFVSVVDCFDAMWNAHDLDAVIEIFTSDAVVTIAGCEADLPKVFIGRGQIREMLQSWLPLCAIRSRSHYVEGGRVIWMAVVSTGHSRQPGPSEMAVRCEAVVRGGEIAALTVSIPEDPEGRLHCQARQGVPHGSTSRQMPGDWSTSFW